MGSFSAPSHESRVGMCTGIGQWIVYGIVKKPLFLKVYFVFRGILDRTLDLGEKVSKTNRNPRFYLAPPAKVGVQGKGRVGV